MDISDDTIEKIAVRVTEVLLQNLFERQRDEISIRQICNEFNISRETVRRRIKTGILPYPNKRGGKNWFSRSVIENVNIKGLL